MSEIKLFQGDCLKVMKKISGESVDCIITSPPYNKLGLRKGVETNAHHWKNANIKYNSYDDNMDEEEYENWQIDFLNECFRLIKADGSVFYNHKVRRFDGVAHFPEWIFKSKLKLYQMIIWDRGGQWILTIPICHQILN